MAQFLVPNDLTFTLLHTITLLSFVMGEIKHTQERAFFSSQGLCLLRPMFSELMLFPALSLFIVLGYSSQRCDYILLVRGSRFGPAGLETKALVLSEGAVGRAAVHLGTCVHNKAGVESEVFGFAVSQRLPPD